MDNLLESVVENTFDIMLFEDTLKYVALVYYLG